MQQAACPIIALAAAVALSACDASGPAGGGRSNQPAPPSFTLGSGATTTLLALGRLDALHVHTTFGQFRLELKTSDAADVRVVSGTIEPGGYNGWHLHPGLGVVAVTAGTLTLFDSDCTPSVYPAGSAFSEQAEHVHIGRNLGTVPAQFIATFIMPAGAAPRVDAPDPGNCP